jgi:GT2 family glycosyltransferase
LPGIDRKLANALKRYGTQLLATASQHYQRAIEQDPDQIETYHQAIELQPDRPELYEGLANALSRTGDITGATVFRQLVKQLQASLPKSLESTHRSSMIPIAASMQCNFNFFKPGEKLTLPYSQTPLVSCIIPVYNEIDYTYHCLQSLSRSLASNTQIEIIVVNDCSTDQTQTVLEQVENLVLINNEKNAGFIRSCNRGASQAKGQYLYFLNNDTEIQAKAIEYLIESLENDETIGAVGSKLVYPNGLLQEAGGIIWNDASGWNYGRMQNPCDPQYNYLRQVDYCSAASLLVRRWVFETLQGFSETFIPAYYEDTDLCFRIRHELGLQVVYQPRSEVVHYEGISSGTSTDEGVKHYQIINAKKFKDKWQKVLIDYPPNQGLEQVPQAARRHSGKRTVLIINPYPPCYDKESGARRLFEIIKLFKQLNYHVIFAPDNGLKEEPYVSELQDLQVEVLYHQVGYGLPMMEQIKERLPLVDCAWLCFPAIAQRYLPLLRQYPTIRIIYDTIDLHYLRLQRAWEMQLTVNPIEPTPAWVEMQSLELALAKQADLTLTVTSVEQKLLQEQGVQNVAVVPNIHHPYQGNRPSFMERSGLLFIGGYNHPPNVDAVLWLYQAIMPAVWQEIPDLTVTLLGSHPPKEVQQLGAVDPRIIVTGYIADVSPYFLSRRIFVAPLRYGAGMKGKVGQSLEYGLPLVSTSIGVEGMGLVENETVLVADQAATFAAQILRLYQDQDLWKRLSDAALAAVEPFTAKTVCSFLSNLMDRLLESHDQENHRSCKP